MLCNKLDTIETKIFGQSNINEIQFEYLNNIYILMAYVGLPHRVLQLKVVPSFLSIKRLKRRHFIFNCPHVM